MTTLFKQNVLRKTWQFILLTNYLFLHLNVDWIVDTILTTKSENSIDEAPVIDPIFWGMIIVGGCITITLSYVSWRKYKGEKNKNKERNEHIS